MNKTVIITGIIILTVGAVSFYAGTIYHKAQRPSGRFFQEQQQGDGQNQNRRFGANGNQRAVRGEIINADDKSITVKMQDGSSKIILLSDNTSVIEATETSKQALQTGKQVMVFGSNNPDGSITAQNIQLNPQGRFGPQNNPSGKPAE